MEFIRKSKDKKTGIKVTVRQAELRYYVEVYVPKNVFSNSSRVYTRNANFIFFATTKNNLDDHIDHREIINFSINKPYRKGKYGLIRNIQAKLDLLGVENFEGYVILNPCFYIPDERKETRMNLKKLTKEMDKLIQIHSKPYPSGSIYVPYKWNNAKTPYRG